MTRSPGEISKIEAAAQKACAWFRDLVVMVHGLIPDRDLLTGRRSRVAPDVRRKRVDRHRHHVGVEIESWQSVDCLTFAGIEKEAEEDVSLLDRLATLQRQFAAIVDYHEKSLLECMMSHEVSLCALGRMKSPLREFTLPEWLHREPE